MFYAEDILAIDDWKAASSQLVEGQWHTLVCSHVAGCVLQMTGSGPRSLGCAGNALLFKYHGRRRVLLTSNFQSSADRKQKEGSFCP